jgi:hypothetical protein
MSWSFLERLLMQPSMRRLSGGLVAATLAVGLRPAPAAEVYYQPIASLSAETNSNIDLDSGPHHRIEGYLADAATIIGIATQNSSSTFRPRLVYRTYPGDAPDDRLEAYLDFNTQYRTQRSNLVFTGTLERQDEFNAEQTAAVFNDINPGQPLADTGRVTVGGTRDSASVFPKYTYNFSPIIGAGFSGQYTNIIYSPSAISNHVDFEYYAGRAFLSWAFSPRSVFSAGAIGSKYQATKFYSQATGVGANAEVDTTWNPLISTEFTVLDQRTKIDAVLPAVLDTSVNAWGASAAVIYKTQVSQFRLNAGRAISPSGGGGVYTVDRLQFQYDRNVNARFSYRGALVGLKVRALTANIEGDNRTYAQVFGEAKWMLTPTWFVSGGVQYSWQKYDFNQPSDANNRIYLRIGYQGLGQQR